MKIRTAILGIVVLCLPVFGKAQANLTGTWQRAPAPMPINPIHAALLHNGKILVVAGSGNDPTQNTFRVGLWDPNSNSFSQGPNQSWDMFCNGMVVLPDGRAFIVGGNLQYDPFEGLPNTAVYDPDSNQFFNKENMAQGRWYPTVLVLGDGRVMTFSGLNEQGQTNTQVEIYTVGHGWSSPISAPWTPPLYPRLHQLPNGKVFYSGSTTQSYIFDPGNSSWSGVISSTNYGGNRTYGSAVLLPLLPDNYTPRVMIFGGGNPATASTEIIDLSSSNPSWKYGPSMSQPRIEMNATLLPTGQVLTVGGSLNDEDTSTASLQADLYDSHHNSMGSAGANAVPRLYHSVSLLLPDGTVWVAGGNPARGSYESSVEIYSPPYLFSDGSGTPANRPSITSVTPGTIGYGTTFEVQSPEAANVDAVVLMRNGSVTHAFDVDQRMIGLNVSLTNGALQVTGPPNGNIAPPGYYMLFLMSHGVPSVASFVQVSPNAVSSAPAASLQPNSSVNFPDTTINTPSTPLNVTIKNTGTSDLHVSGLAIKDVNSADFAVTNDPCTGTAITPNVTCTLAVTFTPSGTGPRKGKLEISDDAKTSPQVLTLTGNGMGVPAPNVTLNPNSVLFPSTVQGTSSTPAVVTITNTGNAPLNVTSVAVTLATPEFTLTNTCSSAVAANATCTVSVVFTPTAVGTQQGTLQITDNAPGSPHIVPLSGTSTAPVVKVPSVSVPSAVSVTATQGTSSPTAITVTNEGNAPLHISGVTFGGGSALFVNPTTNPCPAAVTTSCVISVSFAPLSTTGGSETLSISDDAPGSPHVVTVNGTVTPAFTVTSPATALTATVTAGQTAAYTLQLTPGTGYTGSVNWVCSAPTAVTCTVTPNPVALSGVTNSTITVTTTAHTLLLPLVLFYYLLMVLAVGHLCRKARYTPARLAYSLIAILWLAGCGGGSITTPPTVPPVSQPGAQQGTYTIVLTPSAASSSGQPLTQLTPVQLTLTVK
jgi:hypothetical protein